MSIVFGFSKLFMNQFLVCGKYFFDLFLVFSPNEIAVVHKLLDSLHSFVVYCNIYIVHCRVKLFMKIVLELDY